jgi:hypothetical protein
MSSYWLDTTTRVSLNIWIGELVDIREISNSSGNASRPKDRVDLIDYYPDAKALASLTAWT